MSGTRPSDDDEARRSEVSSLQPYRSLIESAPDAILFADADTGELVEANEAAEELLERPREEIVGMHQTDLHPPGDADAYREQFARHIESSGTLRRLPDGRQMYVVDAEGEQVPVEINAKAVTVDGEHLIHGIFRDLTRRLHHETALATLNETSRQLLAVDTAEEVHRLVVEAATEALDLAYVTVYVFDVAEGRLRPAERSGDVDDLFGELPTLEPGESVAWRAFTEGEELIYDDVTEADDVVDADVPIRSALFVPLGDHGVLLAGDTAPAAFEGSQTEHASVLGATATAALDRVERDRRLRRRDEMLAERNEQLERVEGLNRVLREVDRMLVRADTRESVEQTVCERLLHTNPVSFAWIGEANPVDGRVDVRSAVGTGLGYLSDVDLGTESGTEPAVATVRSGETTMVVNVADGVRTEEWRGSAIAYGFRSVLAIPLTYRDVLYGVLAVYAERPSAFEGPFRDVLEEFGSTVAHAVNAIERRDALLSDEARVLVVEVADARCSVLRFAREAETTLDFEGLSTRDDGTVAVIVTTDSASAERLVRFGASDPTVVEASRVGGGDGSAVVQLTIDGPFIGTLLADHGLNLRSLTADADLARAEITAPASFSPRRVMEVVESRFPEAGLVATYDADDVDEDRDRSVHRSLDALTDRQLEAAQLAYHAGYFDSSRKVAGDELAAAMDISPSAFHRHLREAERKTFESLFASEPAGDRALEAEDGEGSE